MIIVGSSQMSIYLACFSSSNSKMNVSVNVDYKQLFISLSYSWQYKSYASSDVKQWFAICYLCKM